MSEEVQVAPERIFAGFWIRSVSHLIDFILVNAVELSLEYGISTPLQLSGFAQQVIGIGLSIGLSYGYYVHYQVKTGTTIGKKLFGIYVIDEKTGATLSRKQAIFRLIGYIGSYLMVGCGFLMAAFHPQKKAFHDLIAGTVSVRRPKVKATN
jgi:uncharacterized RDD family membrane protein YckC